MKIIGGIVALLLLVACGCGGDGGNGDRDAAAEIAEANGLPSGPTVDCSSGDVNVTGGEGTVTVNSGDNCDGGVGNAPVEEDEGGGSLPGEPLPPFLGS